MKAKGILILIIVSGSLWAAHYFFPKNLDRMHSSSFSCRPSLPAAAAAHAGSPVILFVGNSLIFDHGWRIPSITAVNCARQGLRARVAQQLIDTLPNINPIMIVLALGSVEAARAKKAAASLDSDGFAQSVKRISEHLHVRWPKAPIVWVTVPLFSTDLAGSKVRASDIQSLNEIFANLPTQVAGTIIFDLNETMSQSKKPITWWSYDGIHLSQSAYFQLERRLKDFLPR